MKSLIFFKSHLISPQILIRFSFSNQINKKKVNIF